MTGKLRSRTIQFEGEEWLVELSEFSTSLSGKRKILRFSKASANFVTNVSADTHLDELSDEWLCEALQRLRKSVP